MSSGHQATPRGPTRWCAFACPLGCSALAIILASEFNASRAAYTMGFAADVARTFFSGVDAVYAAVANSTGLSAPARRSVETNAEGACLFFAVCEPPCLRARHSSPLLCCSGGGDDGMSRPRLQT